MKLINIYVYYVRSEVFTMSLCDYVNFSNIPKVFHFFVSGTSTKRLFVHCVQIELEFRNVGFGERGKPEYPEKNLSERGRETTTQQPHMTPGPGFEPGPHWWEASALTTAPSLLPRPLNKDNNWLL